MCSVNKLGHTKQTETNQEIQSDSFGTRPKKMRISQRLHGYTVHQTMLKPFYCQLMHIMLKNTELLKHSKITLLNMFRFT